MKIKSRLNFNFELEVKRSSRKKKGDNKKSFFKKSVIWIVLELLSILLQKLVTWIINVLTNRPFYFYNRIFLFKGKAVLL